MVSLSLPPRRGFPWPHSPSSEAPPGPPCLDATLPPPPLLGLHPQGFPWAETGCSQATGGFPPCSELPRWLCPALQWAEHLLETALWCHELRRRWLGGILPPPMMKGPRHALPPTPCCSGIRDPLLTRRPPPAEEARARGSRQRPGRLRPHAPSARLLGCQHLPPSSGPHCAPDVAGTCLGGFPPSCPKASSAPAPQLSTLGPLLPPRKSRLDPWGLS